MPVKLGTHKAPEKTRQNILLAAFAEFYLHGFQGGSLNHIIEQAGITKGALFHHFPNGKQQLGLAVVDEVIGPLLRQRWMEPLAASADPIAALQGSFRRYVHEDIASGHFVQGCPLNNLAQEMSPLDAGFHQRIDALYDSWRAAIASALTAGIAAGTVSRKASPRDVAALVVASQMGIYGTGKSSQDKQLMTQAAEAVCTYLDALRP
ncbi:MAG TPA: TetR/AcrR family transcriptional regulator [Terriglobales bacterium]|nr:TetR/AcrR family transcriptional regulator [Terriglobales bacterium]